MMLRQYGLSAAHFPLPYLQQHSGQNHQRAKQGQPPVFGKAGDQVANSTHGNDHKGVLHLGLHMVDMVGLGTGAGHDGSIRNRRNMVTADSTSQDSRYRNDHHGRVQFSKHVDHDGHKNSKGAPAGAGRKGNKNCNAEDNQRHKVHQAGIQIDGRTYKGTDTQGVRHTFQSPGQH